MDYGTFAYGLWTGSIIGGATVMLVQEYRCKRKLANKAISPQVRSFPFPAQASAEEHRAKHTNH